MRYCPNCHYEYEDWATTCSDCGTALAAGSAPVPTPPLLLDPAQFRNWVVLMNVPNVMMGTLLKDQLEQAGVPVLMKRAHATDIAEFSHNDFAWQDLYVPERFVVRARRLLASPPSRPYHSTETADEGWDADETEDEFVEEEVAGGDVLGAPAVDVRSGWYLIDSAQPLAASETGPAALPAPRPVALPGLSRYRQSMTRRKDHVPPPAPESRVLPFRPPVDGSPPPDAARDDAWADDQVANSRTTWTHARIYRILIGLVFLAWTLPYVLQMLQYFRDAFGSFFP